MLIRLTLALVCGLALAAPSLAGDDPPPFSPAPVVPRYQADWKLIGEASTTVSVNRIYYARVPGETKRWKARLSSYDRNSTLPQDFSHTGLLAIFLTPRASGFTIEGVFPREDGSLDVRIRAAPPPTPLPTCVPPPGALCAVIPIIHSAPEASQYLLIAIRKGSLPAPVKRLYITEVP